MKTLAAIILAALLTGCATHQRGPVVSPSPINPPPVPGGTAVPPSPKLISFTWDANNPATPEYSYWLIATTNLAQPQSNWQWLTNVPGTTATVWVTPAAMYFACVASNNFWGLTSDLSNVLPAPAPANPTTALKLNVTK